jgi:hypothetical protein
MKWQHLSFVSAFRKSNPLFDSTISNPERRVSRKIESKKNGQNLTWNFIRFGGLFFTGIGGSKTRTEIATRPLLTQRASGRRFVEKKSTRRRGTGATSTHSRYRDPRTRLRGIASLERCSPRRALRARSRACFARGAPPTRRPDPKGRFRVRGGSRPHRGDRDRRGRGNDHDDPRIWGLGGLGRERVRLRRRRRGRRARQAGGAAGPNLRHRGVENEGRVPRWGAGCSRGWRTRSPRARR